MLAYQNVTHIQLHHFTEESGKFTQGDFKLHADRSTDKSELSKKDSAQESEDAACLQYTEEHSCPHASSVGIGAEYWTTERC